MKTYINLLKAVAVTACACLSCAGGNSHSANEAQAPCYDTLSWSDSVTIDSINMARVRYSFVTPTANSLLADSMKEWILAQMGDSIYTPDKDLYEVVKRIGFRALHDDAEELTLITREVHSEYGLHYERDINVEVAYEDDDYVTLCCTTYMYMAGAHGSTAVNYATFSKPDGHIMGWDLLLGMTRQEVIDAIKQGLVTYFQAEDTESMMRDCIMLPYDCEDLPLPTTAPYRLEDGTHVIYQQYEIACYAAGMPECVVRRAE